MDFSRKTRKVLWAVVAFVAMTAFVLVIIAIWSIAPPDRHNDNTVEITVKHGQSVAEIAATMHQKGIIKSEGIFMIYVRFSGIDEDLKAGRYILSPSMPLHSVIEHLVRGLAESEDIVVTIPEGSNIWDVDKILFRAALISYEGDFARQAYEMEGYLFPDTYRFYEDVPIPDIVKRMKAIFGEKAGEYSDEEIIIASLLEKEAKTPEDMSIVSGIIHERLKREMLLQIDASVAYGWCLREAEKNEFSKNCNVVLAPLVHEIKINSPYNTYRVGGLPVAPISNPGLISLHAARNPQESDYLYYLSTRDGSEIIYSRTSSEHLKNRRKYLGF